MAESGKIRAGRAFVELGVENTKFIRGLRLAEKTLRAFGDKISRLGLQVMAFGSAALSPLVGSAKIFSNLGDEIAKMSERTGFSVETLSELKYVASQSDVELSSLGTAISKMQRSIIDAGRGLKTQKDALEALGLSFEQLKDLSPEEQFMKIAEALGKIEDPTQKAALAMMIFSRAGIDLMPIFNLGAEGMEKLRKQARELGLTMTSESATAAASLNDAMSRLVDVVKMIAYNIGSALAPSLEKVTDFLSKAGAKAIAFIKANKGLVTTIAGVAAGLVAAGGAIWVVGKAFGVVAFALSGFTAVAGIALSAIKAIGIALPMLATPLGAITALLTAAGSAFFVYSKAGEKAIESVVTKWQSLKDETMKTLDAIKAAMASGDIGAAARVAWSYVKMEWANGVAYIGKLWYDFKAGFLSTIYSAFYGMQAAWEFLQNALAKGITEAVIFIAKEAQSAFYSALMAWQFVEKAVCDGVISTAAAAKEAWAVFVSWWKHAVNSVAAVMLDVYNWFMGLFDENWDKDAFKAEVTKQLEIDDENVQKELDEKIKKIEGEKTRRKDSVQKDFDKNLGDLVDQENDARKRLDEMRRQMREEMQTDHENKLREIVDNDKSTQTEIEKSRSDRIKQLEKEVEDARSEWFKALHDVRSTDAEGGSKPKSISKLGTLTAGGLELAKVTSAGAFSNFARFGMQGDAAERMATGIDAIAKNTKDLLDETREMTEGTV